MSNGDEKPKLYFPEVPHLPTEEEVYEKKIGAAYWFVTHKFLLRNILTAVFVGIDIILLATIIYFLVFNLGIYGQQYNQSLLSLTTTNPDYQSIVSANLPQEFQYGQIRTYSNRDKYDISAEIQNPNDKWWATFDYQFQLGQGIASKRKGFILPGETKRLLDLSVDNGNTVRNLAVTEVKWYKEINFIRLFKDRYNFNIENVDYIPFEPDEDEESSEPQVAVNKVVFDVTNLSAYNYRSVTFQVFLKGDVENIAINQIVANDFKSGEKRGLQVNFFQGLSRVTNVEIVPVVNILDDDNFIKF